MTFAALDGHPELAPLLAAATPAFAFARDGRTLAWANAAAAAFWGVADRAVLANVGWGGLSVADQIATLSGQLAPGTPARLQALRLAPFGRTTPLVATVRRIDAAGGALVLIVAPALRGFVPPAPPETPAADQAPAPALVERARRADDGPRYDLDEDDADADPPIVSPAATEARVDAQVPPAPRQDRDPEPDVAASIDAEPPAPIAEDGETAGGAALDPRAAALQARSRPLRFGWSVGADGQLDYVTPEAVAAFGADAMPKALETFAAFAARVDLGDGGALARALEAGDAFSDVAAAWPISGSRHRAEVLLSAAPTAGGFSGLGVVRGLMSAPAAVAAQAPPSDAAETADEPDDAAALPPTPANDDRPPQPPAVLAHADRATLERIREVLGGAPVMPASGAPVPPEVTEPPVAPAPTGDDEEDAREDAAARTAAEVDRDVQAEPSPAAESPVAPPPAAADEPGFVPPHTPAPPAEPDVLALRLGDAEMRRRELEAILDIATDGVVVLSANGRILSLNATAEALFGHDRAGLIGEPFTRLFAPQSRRAVEDYVTRLAENGVQSLLNDGRDVQGLEKNGGTLPLFLTLGRIGADGDAPKFCAVLRDVTAWKTAEAGLVAARQAAERASNAKSDFLAKVSHEIRTPLNAIVGFSEVMMEERFGRIENERYRGYVRDIHASGQHIMSLVNDLLDLAKIEAGKLDLHPGAVRLADMVQQTIAILQPQATRDGVILRTSLPSLPAVVADPRSVRQILLNLVSNAIKFTRAGGQVIVSTARLDGGEIAIKVRDTGVGMSPREIEMALEPFRQVPTVSRRDDGTGLGLPLTKALAEANRARFEIESTPGEGTLVQVVFPATRVLAE